MNPINYKYLVDLPYKGTIIATLNESSNRCIKTGKGIEQLREVYPNAEYLTIYELIPYIKRVSI